MILSNGYIKIDRRIMNWEWYTDTNTFVLFIHLLLLANWRDNRFMGREIPRGSLVTSIGHLAEGTNLTVKQVRTALEHLKATGEISIQATNKYSVITVTNYGLYQDEEPESASKRQANGKQTANEGQTKGNQRATTEERKKERKEEYNIALPFSEKFAEVWERWKTYRTEIKHKLTASTEASQLKKLSAYSESDAIAMIEQSIENGWQGLFPIKNQKNSDKSWMQMLQDYHSDQPQEEGEKDLW